MIVTIENVKECREVLKDFFETLGSREFTSTQYKKIRMQYCEEHHQTIYDPYYKQYRPNPEIAPYCLEFMINSGYIVKTGEEVFMRKGTIYTWGNETWDAEWKVDRYYQYLVDCRGYKFNRREFFKEVHEKEVDIPTTRFLYAVNWLKINKILGG